ncbi:hypothetical protein AAZX31_U006700 [Glycine max]
MSYPYFIKLHLIKSAAKDDLEHLQLMKNVCLGSIPEIHMESCDVSSLFHSLQIETFLFNFANIPEIIIISVDLEKETCRSLFLPDDFCFVDTNIGVFRDSL